MDKEISALTKIRDLVRPKVLRFGNETEAELATPSFLDIYNLACWGLNDRSQPPNEIINSSEANLDSLPGNYPSTTLRVEAE